MCVYVPEPWQVAEFGMTVPAIPEGERRGRWGWHHAAECLAGVEPCANVAEAMGRGMMTLAEALEFNGVKV